jgi:hypothetical protein
MNNFCFYADPETGRFVFIPWGIDVTLFPDGPWGGEIEPPPGVAWAHGMVARRLYENPDSRAAYLARLAELLEHVWDPGGDVGDAQLHVPDGRRRPDVVTRHGVLVAGGARSPCGESDVGAAVTAVARTRSEATARRHRR